MDFKLGGLWTALGYSSFCQSVQCPPQTRVNGCLHVLGGQRYQESRGTGPLLQGKAALSWGAWRKQQARHLSWQPSQLG